MIGGVAGGIGGSLGGRYQYLNRQQTVYRVYGGSAKSSGYSWTPKNPGSVTNYRNSAGLPGVNTGRFVIKGSVQNRYIIKTRSVLPLDGNKGGLPEYIIDPNNVNIINVSGVNPEF